MTFVLYTNSISVHQLPLAREIVKCVGVNNFRYVYTGTALQGGAQEVAATESWIIQDEKFHPATPTQNSNAKQWLENCDVLLCGGLRPFDLLERRAAKGLKTFYQSERWFKPIYGLPGWLRLLHPGYVKMAWRFRRLVKDPSFHVLPIGPHAKRDFRLLGVPDFKMMDWGYFVEEGLGNREQGIGKEGQPLKVLYVGRFLALKRIDTIIRAVAQISKNLATIYSTTTTQNYNSITLTIVGDGPEKPYLQKLASSLQLQLPTATNSSPSPITFLPPVSLERVRQLMSAHDIFVFASNGYDGWGAVVSEALLEGMVVLGTYESGAPATLLPPDHLFHCGDVKGLVHLLENWSALSPNTIGEWTAERGAQRLLALYDERQGKNR